MSATAVIEIVSVVGPTVDFWAAEVPRGDRFHQMVGWDHPSFALIVVCSARSYDNDLARAVGSRSDWNQLAGEYVLSLGVIDRVTFTGAEVPARSRAIVDALAVSTKAGNTLLALAPRVLYRATFSDARWVAHLSPGDTFESSAFSALEGARPSWVGIQPPRELARIAAARDRIVANPRWHVWRNVAVSHEPGKPLWGDWEGKVGLFASNRVREVWLAFRLLAIAYFDTTEPGFKPGKSRFKKDAAAHGLDIRSLPVRPRGFSLAGPGWGDNSECSSDGTWRARLDYLHPEGVAWVDLQGEPLVRIGTLEAVAPDAGAVHLDDFLRATAERLEADASLS